MIVNPDKFQTIILDKKKFDLTNKQLVIYKFPTVNFAKFNFTVSSFFSSCCYETVQFRVNLCFGSSEHNVQTANDNNKVSYFKNALVLNISYRYYVSTPLLPITKSGIT